MAAEVGRTAVVIGAGEGDLEEVGDLILEVAPDVEGAMGAGEWVRPFQ